jgi:hypothetical protein
MRSPALQFSLYHSDYCNWIGDVLIIIEAAETGMSAPFPEKKNNFYE